MVWQRAEEGRKREGRQQRTRKAFYRASPLAELSETLIALTAFCASRDSDGRDGESNRGYRKIEEAKVVAKKERIRERER